MSTPAPFAIFIRRLSAGFWLLFFITLPFAKGLNSVAEVGLLILGLVSVNYSSFRQTVWRYRHVAAIALIFAALILGMLYTENTVHGFKMLKHQHRFLVVPAMFLLHAAWVRHNFLLLLKVFCTSVAVACVATVLLFWLPEDFTRGLVKNFPMLRDYPENFSRVAFGLYSPFIDRIQFSSLIGLAILSCIYLLTKPKKWLALLLLPVLGYTMMVLGGRGGQVALLVALLIPGIFWFYKLLSGRKSALLPKPLSAIIASVFVVVVLAFLPFAAYHTNSAVRIRANQAMWEIKEFRSGDYDPDNFLHFTTVRRLVSWQNMWQVAKQNPIIGTGTGDYNDALTKAYENDNFPHIENIHSQYLMFWGMLGILGLALFLWIMFYWAARMRNQDALTVFAWSVLLFYAVNMIPDAVLYAQIDNMAFCAFLSLIGLQRADEWMSG